MTTPNIEELIDRLYDWHNTSAEQNRLDMQKAADLLQSQAERIKELEGSVAHWKAFSEAAVNVAIDRREERDTLRDQLAAIAATEPVAKLKPCKEGWFIDLDNPPPITGETIELFTRPMPAKDVNAELVEALKRISSIEDEMQGGDWEEIEEARTIARTALAKYKGAK